MLHERTLRIEIFNDSGEPHSEPRWHKQGEAKLCDTCDESEELQREHPEAKLGVREIIINVYQWPPLVSGGYEPSPNDQRQLDLEAAKSA
jgi:hypothetical protein